MAFRQTFIAAGDARPFWPSVLETLRQTDATAGLSADNMTATVDKETPWTQAQISGTQNIIDAAPRDTPQIRAQFDVDDASIFQRAFFLTLLDQINVLRANDGLGAVTPAQALAAVRTKAGQLS